MTMKSHMSAEAYRSALEKIGLTQQQFADLIGVSVRTAHGYANGFAIPKVVALLLKILLRHHLRPENLPEV